MRISICICRELNPGIKLGRLTCYHYITDAEIVPGTGIEPMTRRYPRNKYSTVGCSSN